MNSNNQIKKIENYAFVRQTSIDIEKLTHLCMSINNNLKLILDEQNDDYVDDSYIAPLSTRCYNQYNLICFVKPPLHAVYSIVRDTFRQIVGRNVGSKDYFMQCWLNIFSEKSPALGWHSHFEEEIDAYHGFLVVKANNSYTEYKKPDNSKFKVTSKDGLLVMTKSFQDLHRTSPVEKGETRITIAFDIVTSKSLSNYNYVSTHWIPI
tara:strand:+ start:159 stop:782 length:624 start_codon:yes stop_codon:yes gene_type:complete